MLGFPISSCLSRNCQWTWKGSVHREMSTESRVQAADGMGHSCKYTRCDLSHFLARHLGRQACHGLKAGVRWRGLLCSSDTYKMEYVFLIPLGVTGRLPCWHLPQGPSVCWKPSFPVIMCSLVPAAAPERAGEGASWACVHFVLYIIQVLNLLEDWA